MLIVYCAGVLAYGLGEEYEAYAATTLGTLAVDVATVQADLRRGDLAAAKVGWLAAQLD